MKYNKRADQIIIYSEDTLIFVDTYTFRSVFSISIYYISSLNLIEDTNYIILTIYYNHILIFDFIKQITLLNMDNSGDLETFPDNSSYKLLTGEIIILTTNDMGVITWTFNEKDMFYQFNGYIQDSKVEYEGDGYRQFTKHPTQDIIFMSGYSLEIIAVKIVDIQNKKYETLLKDSLTQYTSSDNSLNIIFDYIQLNGSQQAILVLNTNKQIYVVYLDISEDYNQINVQSYYSWYKQEGSTTLYISSKSFITAFNYDSFQQRAYMNRYGNSYSSRFVRQNGQNINQLIFLNQNQITISTKDDFTSTQIIDIPYNVIEKYGNFYQIKNCTDGYLAKIKNTQSNSQILTFDLSSIDQSNKIVDITDTFGLNWSNINQNLDPFYLNGQIYVALAFPQKENSLNYLFLLMNCQSTSEKYYLTSDSNDVTQIQTAFAVASLENLDNLELIGVDNKGSVYSWDLSSSNFAFKYSKNFNFCKNSLKGDVFHFQKLKRLILSCDDNKIYSLDLVNEKNQFLVQLSEQPLALKAFSGSSLIALGDINSGLAYIYKFNPTSIEFDFFLSFKFVGIKDKIIYIDMLHDDTLWISYVSVNIFYSIQDCLSDQKLCTECSQEYYFDVNNYQDSHDLFGIGAMNNPYSTSENFFTALSKAQQYKQLIQGVADIGVNILIDPENKFQLNQNFLNIDFNKIISLNLKSINLGKLAVLEYKDILELNNYNFVGLQDILIEFSLSANTSSCGINFQSIKQGVLINNIQLKNYNSSQTTINCQSIYVQSTNLTIQNYTLQNEDFTNHLSVITSFSTQNIAINNFSLINCTLGNSFSVLKQQSQLQVYMSNLNITLNKCPNIEKQDNSISVLFSAGFFSLNGLEMSNNIFCKKSIFSTVTSGLQSYQAFSFQNIQVFNNYFQARSTYIFFDALYQMNVYPQHEIQLQNINFFNNKLFQQTSNDLEIAQYFELAKIGTVNAQNIIIKNHLDIQFGLIQNSNFVDFNFFQCFNDQEYFLDLSNQATNGCLQLKEIMNTKLQKVKVYKKQLQDTTLISLENDSIQESSLLIDDGEFTDLVLQQKNKNTQAIPIKLFTNYNIEIIFQVCNFKNLFLQSIQISQTFSVTAIWVYNLQGSVLIKDSLFQNSYSNSMYGFMNIQTNTLQMERVNFKNSTFTEVISLPLFSSKGGMLNAKVQTLNITNSNFSQSTASKGAFFYLTSTSQSLQIDFESNLFSEGYALVDGGAIFIEIQGKQFTYNSINCQYNSLYTLNMQMSSSIIALQFEQISSRTNISFIDGSIKNIQGTQQNYFIKVEQANLKLINISSIDNSLEQQFSRSYQIYSENINKQQPTLIQAINSEVLIQNCSISNFSITKNQYQEPILIYSQSSVLNLTNSQMRNCEYFFSFINFQGGQLNIDNTHFLSLTQVFNQRLMAETGEIITNMNQYSLIIVQDAEVNVLNKSKFSQISCSLCNGGTFQINNGKINIQDAIFEQISVNDFNFFNFMNFFFQKSLFGGAIYIFRLYGDNFIQNSQFTHCQSLQDGGSLLLKFIEQDNFSLNINKCLFQDSMSQNGRGGAIMAYSDTINPQNIIINLNDVQFIENQAQIGGAIYQKNLSLKLFNSIFEGNKAKIFGQNLSSYATKLQLVNYQQFSQINPTNNQNMIEIMSFRSGNSLNNMQFMIVNDENEKMYPVSDEEIANYQVSVRVDPLTQNYDNYQINGELQAKYQNESQLFVFSEIKIVGSPNTYVILQFYSNQINVLDKETNQYLQNYTLNIKINFRDCIQGEQITQYNNLTQCDICKVGQYSFTTQQCLDCPFNAECLGGDKIVTKQGYWRKSNKTDLILKCENLQENCIGGDFGNNICYEGHIGALCEECDIYGEFWQQSYSKSSKYSCAECNKMSYNIFILAGLTCWTLFCMSKVIMGNIESIKFQFAQLALQKAFRLRCGKMKIQNNLSKTQKKYYWFFREMKNLPLFQLKPNFKKMSSNNSIKQSICIKMLTNYFQIASSIATFNLTIPSGVFEFSMSVSNPIKQTMSSLDCFLVQIESETPLIYFRMIFSQLIPIFYLVIFSIGICGIYIFKNKKRNKFPFFMFSTVIIFLIIYLQPDIVAQVIALISCRNIGGTSYILSNVAFECYTDQHIEQIKSLIIPIILVWLFLLPLSLFFLLYKNRNQLEEQNIKLNLGYLYNEYKKEAYYWEFVKMAQKLAIILSLNFYSQNIQVKGLLVFLSITIYGILTIVIKPYQYEEVNQIDLNSTTICSLTVLLGVFIFQNPFSYLQYPSYGIIIIINFIFIIYLLNLIINNYLAILKEIIQNFLIKLSKKISFFKKFQTKFNVKTKNNSQVKYKVQRAFKRYLSMTQVQRKEFFMLIFDKILSKVYESKFCFNLKNYLKAEKQQNFGEIESIGKSGQIQMSDINSFRSSQDNFESIFNPIKLNNFQTLAGLQQKSQFTKGHSLKQETENIQSQNY